MRALEKDLDRSAAGKNQGSDRAQRNQHFTYHQKQPPRRLLCPYAKTDRLFRFAVAARIACGCYREFDEAGAAGMTRLIALSVALMTALYSSSATMAVPVSRRSFPWEQ